MSKLVVLVFLSWTDGLFSLCKEKMAPRRPPPSPPQPKPSESTRMLEVVLQAMQQQNAALGHSRLFFFCNSSPRVELGKLPPTSSNQVQWEVQPDEVNHWFRDIEIIYTFKRCPDENKLAYTEYLLTEEAGHWLSNMKMILERSVGPISWELFKTKFYTKYFPDSVSFYEEIEFLQLVQGSMLIIEYVDRFKHLPWFYTLAIDEEWQCRKFENGLRGDIELLVKGLRIQELPTLVEMACVMEKTKKEVEGQ
ncbi:uncharacterized protein LOC106770209 [Vigna radiata var. radiata]|uniref:Uncharacterized protein LOC106770209 n=1 Tax=Vigna radiata var. radiata TaxID=3916 RepID=A0A1S3V046_VIGRR|nr:uncharacterized protein LOC106770209 [Vigna radiata var. radiata]